MLTQHPSWEIIDSSKLSDMKRCPRYYFYRNIFGWRSGGDHDLVFGEAFHRAKELILRNPDKTPTELIAGAMARFNQYYREFFGPETDMDFGAKNPGSAQNMLEDYLKLERPYSLLKFGDRLATEIHGVVPLDMEGRKIHFRIDAMVKLDSGKIAFIDHKTTGSDRQMYQRAWSISGQMGTYDHVISCLYGADNCSGGFVELHIFRKETRTGKGNDYLSIPLNFGIEKKQQWLWTTTNWVIEIERNMEALIVAKEDHPVLMAFPQNESGCIKYNRLCSFFDICMARANPLTFATTPIGYRVEFWDPSERSKESEYLEL